MKNSLTTAWLIGNFDGLDVETRIRNKGYTITKFDTLELPPSLYDTQPNLIIFSETNPADKNVLTSIKSFFPEAIVIIVSGQSWPKPNTEKVNSIDRLVKSLKGMDPTE